MNKKEKKLLDDLIVAYREIYIDTNKNINSLRELTDFYYKQYDNFQCEFDCFTSKLFNLGTLVTVLLGFYLTIGTFLYETGYLNNLSGAKWCVLLISVLSLVALVCLLVRICLGVAFSGNFLIPDVNFPLEAEHEHRSKFKPSCISTALTALFGVNSAWQDEKVHFYQKMLFAIYKIVKTNTHIFENRKKGYEHAFTIYIICVIMSVCSLVFICWR